jgi:hypothetical protein
MYCLQTSYFAATTFAEQAGTVTMPAARLISSREFRYPSRQ